MGSLWNRMKSSPLADTNLGDTDASSDKDQAQPPALSVLETSPTRKKENNVNKSQSAPQPTCVERIHYPIYDPLNPRHNPVVARSRSAPFPNGPKTKTVNSPKSGGWTRMSPVRSLRKAKSGFLAFTEELRSKPSFCCGESTSKPFSPTSDPISPTKQGPKEWNSAKNPGTGHFSPTSSSPDAAPTLKLDIQSSQMSLSPFAPSPPPSAEDETPFLDNASVSRPFSNSSKQPAIAASPRIPYDGPSFLPLPEIHPPLEDPFQNASSEPCGLSGVTKPDYNSSNLMHAPQNTETGETPPEIINPEEDSYVKNKSCSVASVGGLLSGDKSLHPTRGSSSPTESAQKECSNHHPTSDSTIVSEEVQSRSSQSSNPQKSIGLGDPLKPRLSAKNDHNPRRGHPSDVDSSDLSLQNNQLHTMAGTSETETCERLSETSTDEDSDFGIEIYRTQCLSEQKSLPLIPDSTSTTSVAIDSSSLGAVSSNKLDRFQEPSLDSSIATARNTTTIGQQSTKIQQRSSEDSSSKSTIRWRDGYVRQERPDPAVGSPSKKASSRNSRSMSSGTSATTVNTNHEAGGNQPIGPNSTLKGIHLHSIRTKDYGPLAPWGDLRHSVEAIDRRSGLQLSGSSEALLFPTSQESTALQTDTEQIQSREDSEYPENKLGSSSLVNSTQEPEKSNIQGDETTSTSPVESLASTVSCAGRSDGSMGSDELLIRKEITGSNSTGSSQADTRSGSTVIGKCSTNSSDPDPRATSDGHQSVDISAKPFNTAPTPSSTDGKDDLSQVTCRRIISDGIHSGPGLDRDDPAQRTDCTS